MTEAVCYAKDQPLKKSTNGIIFIWFTDKIYSHYLDLDLDSSRIQLDTLGHTRTPSVSVKSYTTSASSQVNPIFCRSLLTVLLQFALGRPGPLLYPSTYQYSACCGMRWWSMRKTCPSQRSRLSLSMLSMVCCPVLVLTSTFVILSCEYWIFTLPPLKNSQNFRMFAPVHPQQQRSKMSEKTLSSHKNSVHACSRWLCLSACQN